MKYFFIKASIVYDLTNQLTIVGVYNYHMFYCSLPCLFTKQVIINFAIILYIVNFLVFQTFSLMYNAHPTYPLFCV